MSIPEIITSLELGLIYGIVAMGIYFTFRVIDFPDLTCDGSFMTGSAVCAVAIKSGLPPMVGVFLGLMAGSLCGLTTGLLHVYGRITNLLAGILTAFILYSINLRIMGGIPNLSLPLIPYEQLGLLTVFALVVWIISSYLLTSDFGLALRSIGSNPRLAGTQGISVSVYTLIGLALSNALIGMGGALFCVNQGFSDISQGLGAIVVGFAAVIIGEKILPYRNMWVRILACIVGSVLYRFVIAFSLHSAFLGLVSSDMNLITGLILIVIMVWSRKSGRALC